jgi:uridylate kinase
MQSIPKRRTENRKLVLAAFGEKAYTHIIHDAMSEQELIRAQKNKANLFVACGGVPGRSTDYGAVKLAQVFGAKEVIIAGDTPYVYEKDPRKFPKAKPISELTWVAYEKLVPKKWTPGLSSPVDPVATQLAKKLKITAKILNGKDIPNFKNAIQNKPFHGTIIS